MYTFWYLIKRSWRTQKIVSHYAYLLGKSIFSHACHRPSPRVRRASSCDAHLLTLCAALHYSFSFVLATIASTGFLNIWQALKVGRARKAAGVDYPQRESPLHFLLPFRIFIVRRSRRVLQSTLRRSKSPSRKLRSSTTAPNVRPLPVLPLSSSLRFLLGAHQNTLESMPHFIFT